MEFTTDTPWRDEFIRAIHVERSSQATRFYRAARAGAYRRLAPGVFLPAPVWSRLDADGRFLARVSAAALASPTPLVFSHMSAAAMWRLPVVGPWPDRAQVVVSSAATGGRSRTAYRAQGDGVPRDVHTIDGLTVTTMTRSLIDVARTQPLSVSVAMLDHAI